MLATMANTTSAGKLVGSCDTSWQSWSRCGQATLPQPWVDTVSILQAVCRYCVHTAGSLSDIYQLYSAHPPQLFCPVSDLGSELDNIHLDSRYPVSFTYSNSQLLL